MNRNRKGAKRRSQTLRVWTYDEARSALPYLTSVMGSLREHWTAAQAHDRRAKRLADRPGRPDRTRLLALQDETTLAAAAKQQFDEEADELHRLDIFCIDPLRGEGVIPFVQHEQLAWFLYDLFDPDALRFWRYHNDPLDKRRAIAELADGPENAPEVA
jgi:hypothetical protein